MNSFTLLTIQNVSLIKHAYSVFQLTHLKVRNQTKTHLSHYLNEISYLYTVQDKVNKNISAHLDNFNCNLL